MAIELQFPSRQLVEEKHDRLIERYGGLPGVRDENALGSAIARAEHLLFYREGQVNDLFDAAAALAWGIRRSHPFADANKRTSWLTMQTFLSANGVELIVDPDDAVSWMVKLANNEISEDELAEQLRAQYKLNSA